MAGKAGVSCYAVARQVYAVVILVAVVAAFKPSFAVELAVVPGLISAFVLAVAVVDDSCAAVLLAVVPG